MILDANLLVLLVVGSASRDLIEKHKRLKEYTEGDFDLLIEMISQASEVYLTPNTLTETSNLIGYISEPARTLIYETFGRLVAVSAERYVPSSAACARPEFLRLGLTDAALLVVPSEDASLLTADLQLFLAAQRSGRPSINFNHFR